jgi:hypothetical protein
MLAWMRMKSGSIWPAALLHASHDLFIPVVFDNLARNTGSTLWYTTQFGAAVAGTSAVFAVYFWLRRSEVEGRTVTGSTPALPSHFKDNVGITDSTAEQSEEIGRFARGMPVDEEEPPADTKGVELRLSLPAYRHFSVLVSIHPGI